MRMSERLRRLSTLVPWTALLLAGCGGGGDKSPTGPDGGTGGRQFDLASIGKVGLPADLTIENCTETVFKSGTLALNDDGTWTIRLQVRDASGDWGYIDQGVGGGQNGAIWLESNVSGVTYQGTNRKSTRLN